MRFTCAAMLLAATLLTAACGAGTSEVAPGPTTTRSTAIPTKWSSPIWSGCSLIDRSTVANVFGVTWDDVDPLDAGNSEHEAGGVSCTWVSSQTPVKHMVNGVLTGSGGFPEGRDASAEYAKWAREEANSDLRPVEKLGDADFCEMSPGGNGPSAELVVLARERLLFFWALEDADNTCETLAKFGGLALATMGGR